MKPAVEGSFHRQIICTTVTGTEVQQVLARDATTKQPQTNMLVFVQITKAMKQRSPAVADLNVAEVALPRKADPGPAVFARQTRKVPTKQTVEASAGPAGTADLKQTAGAASGTAADTRPQPSNCGGTGVSDAAQTSNPDLAGTRQQPGAEEEVGRSAGRPARQRVKSQPYWMTGAAACSPARNSPTGSSPAAKLSSAAHETDPSPSSTAPASGTKGAAQQHQEQLNPDGATAAALVPGKAGGAKVKKPAAAKRQAKASPNKEGALQPAVKKSKAAQQAEAVSSASSVPAAVSQTVQDQPSDAEQVCTSYPLSAQMIEWCYGIRLLVG